MFLGEYEYRIDEKGRVPLPPKFRKEFKDGLVLAAGPEKCIMAYTLSGWAKMAADLTGGGMAPSKMRKLNRAFFATAFNIIMDNQGRIALPVPLREYARIEDELVIAGVNNNLELWNKALWEEEMDTSQEQAWQIIESLERH